MGDGTEEVEGTEVEGTEVVEVDLQEGIEAGLNEVISGNEEPKKEEVPGEEEAKPGEEAKPKEGEEEEPKKEVEDKDDPIIDLGVDDKGEPIKLKRSELIEFRKNGMLHADYTQKTQALAAEKEGLKEVVSIIEFLKKNPSKAEKVMAILEDKAEEAKEDAVDINESIKQIDDLLKDLPDDDPYAQTLRLNRKVMQETFKTNAALQKKLESLDQRGVSEEESKIRGEADQALKGAIASAEESLKFEDPEEAAYWKKQSLMYLVHNKKEYSEMNKEQFTEYFKGIAKKVHDEMNKFGEKHVSRYIKKKGTGNGVPIVGGASGEKAAEPIDLDNLQDNIEKALTSEEGKNT